MLGLVSVIASLPLWLPAAAALDLLRGRRALPTVRVISFAGTYMLFELVGITLATLIFLLRLSDFEGESGC